MPTLTFSLLQSISGHSTIGMKIVILFALFLLVAFILLYLFCSLCLGHGARIRQNDQEAQNRNGAWIEQGQENMRIHFGQET